MKIKILKPFIGSVDGKSVIFQAGQLAEVPDGDADNMIRGKYAEAIEFQAVKIAHKPVSKSKAVK